MQESKGMQPPGACQFGPVEDPSPRVTGGVDAGKKVPQGFLSAFRYLRAHRRNGVPTSDSA